jgi:trehalose/maltose hydrolase-like predicted phosphorylase
MSGTVDLIQRCYTGIETRQDRLQLAPYLPSDLKEIQFSILYRQHLVNVLITQKRLRVSTQPGEAAAITIGFEEETFELNPGDTLEFDLRQ